MLMDRSKRHALVFRGETGVGKTTVRRAVEDLLSDNSSSVVLDHGWGSGEKRTVATTPFDRYSDLLGRPENLLLVELGWGNQASTQPSEWVDLLRADGRHMLVFRLVGTSRAREPHEVGAHQKKLAGINFAKLSGIEEVELANDEGNHSAVAKRILAQPCPHC
jgi:energy-coupling factor transporter ATP-binding protein EcfA2